MESVTCGQPAGRVFGKGESKVIAKKADCLRSRLEYERAKKLRKHCDLVKFF